VSGQSLSPAVLDYIQVHDLYKTWLIDTYIRIRRSRGGRRESSVLRIKSACREIKKSHWVPAYNRGNDGELKLKIIT
jgi:hypothetical protein